MQSKKIYPYCGFPSSLSSSIVATTSSFANYFFPLTHLLLLFSCKQKYFHTADQWSQRKPLSMPPCSCSSSETQTTPCSTPPAPLSLSQVFHHLWAVSSSAAESLPRNLRHPIEDTFHSLNAVHTLVQPPY
ncbi:hypothetical protein AAHE18_07G193900 [Arachis hypogaea]